MSLKGVRDGTIEFAIDQQQYLQGYLSIVMLTLYNKLAVIPVGQIFTGPRVVTQKNGARVIELSAKGIR